MNEHFTWSKSVTHAEGLRGMFVMKKRGEHLSGSDREEKRSGGARPGTRGSDSPMRAARWEIRLAWLLRALILLTAVGHAAQGAWLYVLLCLVAVALVVLPAWIARSSAANLPVEIELVLLWWLVADMTLGRLAALYDTSAWFDKALHLGNSVLLGMLGFLAVYLLHFTGKFPAGKIVTGVIIVVLTLGIGAFWEILEYLSDRVLREGRAGFPAAIAARRHHVGPHSRRSGRADRRRARPDLYASFEAKPMPDACVRGNRRGQGARAWPPASVRDPRTLAAAHLRGECRHALLRAWRVARPDASHWSRERSVDFLRLRIVAWSVREQARSHRRRFATGTPRPW